MSKAFVFPGQGSQAVGMGKALAEAFPQARAVLAEVDEALGQNLSGLMFEGPPAELTLTANAQPALPVGTGAMAALLGLDYDAALAIAKQAADETGGGAICEVANDNGGGQIVVSGSRRAVHRAIEIAKARGARRSILLPVSAPFHCALMQPAAEAMAAALVTAAIKPPCVALVSNVLAAPVTEPEEIRKLLVAQVTGVVRWRESMAFMASRGISLFVECGAGKVLAGLVKRIAGAARGVSIGIPADIERYRAMT